MPHSPTKFVLPILSLVFALLLATGTTRADETPAVVVLKAVPPLHKSIAAFPQIAAPDSDGAAKRINLALAQLDKKFLEAAAGCGKYNAQRQVETTLAGARFLSLVTRDSWFCGAYPDDDRLAMVFDLKSGRPVNWPALLPKSLSIVGTSDSYFDGTKIGMIGSKKLAKLYRDVVKSNPSAEECDSLLEMSDLTFQAWPDAAAGGIALHPSDLPHASKVCAITAVVSTATLRRMGADTALLDDIDIMHARLSSPRK